ncbi:MAG: cysteine-rich CWC family protein [Brachymonas sp.]|nr:cysteine-rich CWC family protein [Brachymonas sp.]
MSTPVPLLDEHNNGKAPARQAQSPVHTGHTCPLCGQANQCAQQSGQPYAACWCMQRPVLGRDWLAQRLVQLGKDEQRCLCPVCHARLEQEKAQAAGNGALALKAG